MNEAPRRRATYQLRFVVVFPRQLRLSALPVSPGLPPAALLEHFLLLPLASAPGLLQSAHSPPLGLQAPPLSLPRPPLGLQAPPLSLPLPPLAALPLPLLLLPALPEEQPLSLPRRSLQVSL